MILCVCVWHRLSKPASAVQGQCTDAANTSIQPYATNTSPTGLKTWDATDATSPLTGGRTHQMVVYMPKP